MWLDAFFSTERTAGLSQRHIARWQKFALSTCEAERVSREKQARKEERKRKERAPAREPEVPERYRSAPDSSTKDALEMGH